MTLAAVSLSVTELRVLELTSQGWSRRAVAHELGLAPRMVRRHLERCCEALDAPNDVAAVVRAIHAGCI